VKKNNFSSRTIIFREEKSSPTVGGLGHLLVFALTPNVRDNCKDQRVWLAAGA